MARFPFQFLPHKRGMHAFLGDLESAVMEQLWDHGPQTVREVRERLLVTRKVAYTTVMTVMSRLADKGLLEKTKEGHAYRYRPGLSREDFQKSTIQRIMRTLVRSFGAPAISQFVESLEHERPEDLEKLARLVEEKRRKRHD